MNKKRYLWIAAVTAILVVAAFFLLRPDKVMQKGQQETVTVARRDIGSNVLATGVIKPMVGAEVRVGSRVSGLVKRIYANVGDFVERGQIIAELDSAELQAKYNQARASRRNAAANFDYAKLDLARQKSLIQKKHISQNQVDLAEKAFDVAKAQMEQARANLEYARVQLDYTQITAPISGIVASVSTQEGETVAASFAAPTFVTIIDLERLEVWAYVDETDIGRIKEGQPATFSVDTYGNIDFKGMVTAIYPKAVIQDNVVNYVVTLKITDHLGKTLRPEMSAKVSIFLKTRKGVLTIPLSAIRRERGQRFVTVMVNGKPVARKVETGWTTGGMIEVTKGLEEGDTVVVSFE